ncbi:hypothetical protein MHYP_G00037700 [Metynnis hypsauchen]
MRSRQSDLELVLLYKTYLWTDATRFGQRGGAEASMDPNGGRDGGGVACPMVLVGTYMSLVYSLPGLAHFRVGASLDMLLLRELQAIQSLWKKLGQELNSSLTKG